MSLFLTRMVKALIPVNLQPAPVAARTLAALAATERVAGGPFRGMIYPGRSVGSANWPKRLGVYECEVTAALTSLDSDVPPLIVNVGAAEGYYALGCARRWPATRVVAFEQDPVGRDLIAAYALRNAVSDRIDVRGFCTQQDLLRTLAAAPRGLLLMDVEGAEDELLQGPVVTALRHYHGLVELHDLRRERLGDRLRERFASTHRVEQIDTRPRRLTDFPYPANPLLRLYLHRQLRDHGDEQRGAPMRWFFLSPLSPAGK